MRRVLVAIAILATGVALVTLGCAGRETASGNGSNDLGFPGGDLGAHFDGGSCAYIKLIPAQAVAPATLTAIAMVSTGAAPSWEVETPSGIVTPTKLDSSGLSVTLDAPAPGSYVFHVSFLGGQPCPGSASADVFAPGALAQVHRVRLTPPASSGLPQQDQLVTVFGNKPSSDEDLFLGTGTSIGGVLKASSGPIPGEVLLVPQRGPEFRAAVGATGSFSLPVKLDAMYELVMLPKDLNLAPHRLGPTDGASLLGGPFLVGVGESVSGVVRDEGAAPLPGARVALRAGALPSGLGTTLGDGSFALRAEAGTYQLAVARDGWADLVFDGLVVPAGGLTVTVDHALSRHAVSFRVVRPDGTTPVQGAKVTARSLPIAAAGTIGWSGGPSGASAVARLVRTSLVDGTLGAATLPAGTYDLLVEPPAPEATNGATTGVRVVVSAAGAIDLVLGARTTLAGHVRNQAGAAVGGARIRALTATGTVAGEVTTGVDGGYALPLWSGVPIDVVVDPPVLGALASRRVHVGASDGALGGALPGSLDVVLPDGLGIGGTVRGPSAAPVAGVAIDVLCLSCGDPTPVAHAESDGNGKYQLGLPDPGTAALDAGTD